MIIQHNIMSLNAHRQMGGNTNQVSKNLEKLSSGYKINRAGDDAAGLAISEKMRAQITGLTRAQSNAQDGISLVQTAEGALTEVHSMLNRMVDLATQSSNGTMQGDDRQKISDEMKALTEEIDRISKSTNFNGIKLLDGNLGGGTAALTGGAKFEDTKATLGNVTTNALTAATAALGANDTLDYTVNWVDKDGKAQETKLSFKAASATSLVAADGTAYAIAGNMTKAEFAGAVMGELAKNDAFSEAFNVTVAADKLTFESATTGANGSKVTGIVSTPSTAANFAGGGTTLTTTAGLDAGKRLDLSAVKVAKGGTTGPVVAGDTVADMLKKAFTIDGKKFLAVDSNVSATEIAEMKAQDKNLTIIKMNDAETTIGGTNAAAEMATVALEINTAFGKSGTAVEFSVATAPNGTAGIAANDILYTSKSTDGLTLQIGDTADAFNKVTVSVADMGVKGLGIDNIDVSLQGVSSDAISTIKAAIETVSVNRSAMGALQNRLEHTINNLGVTTENMTAAESRIRDVDMAKEMAAFTKNNVLTQAAQAMLAQANQQPQQVLQLLR